MAAGTTIKIKRKAGAFTGGQLSAGELGLDVTNAILYGSVDGSTVFSIGAGTGDALQSLTLAQFAQTTSLQLKDTISDETGSGALVFANTPTLVTPTIGVATATSVNKVTITAPATGATLTLAEGSTLATVGAFATTLTVTGATSLTLPTSGTLATQAYVDSAVAGLLDYKGGYNASTNSPDLDVAPSGIFKGDSYTVTAAGNFFSVAVEVGDFLIAQQDDPTLASHWTIVQRNESGLAVTSGTLAQFAATTSAELAGVINDETGTGSLVFANSPTLVTPNLGTPSAVTLTNATGLPLAGVVDSTTEALGVGSLEVGHASDTTISRSVAGRIAVESVDVVTISSTDTLTNKTISAASNIIDGGTI